MNVLNRSNLPVALIIAATALIYSTSYQFTYVNYDDPTYLRYILQHASDGFDLGDLRSLLIDVVNSNWHPVTLASLYIDYFAHKLDPGGIHIHNALIHIINVLLVFALGKRLFPDRPLAVIFMTGAFALHPVNVGTVAWISERKGLLSAMFALISMILYIDTRTSPNRLRSALVLGTFTLSILSKATSVILPLIFMLIDWYLDGGKLIPNNKRMLIRTIKSKGIYFLVALIMGLLTIHAHSLGGALRAMDVIPLELRIGNFVNSIPSYFRMLIIPAEFAFYYPFELNINLIETTFSILFVLGLTLGVFFLRAHRILPFAYLWFFIWLAPLSGIIKSGPHFVADRYMYIAGLGIFAAIGYGLDRLAEPGRKKAAAAIVVGVFMLYSASTYSHLQFWRSPIELYTHALDVTKENVHAETNLAQYYATYGDIERAMKHYRRLRTYARYLYVTYSMLSETLTAGEHFDAAEEVVNDGLDVYPGNYKLMALKSEILRATGRLEEALALCKEALKKHPKQAVFAMQIGRIHAEMGNKEKARMAFRHALALEPDNEIIVDYLSKLDDPVQETSQPTGTSQ